MIERTDFTTFLTVKEVAKLLRSSERHIFNAINGRLKDTAALPAIKVGRKWLITKEAFEAWLELNSHSDGKTPTN